MAEGSGQPVVITLEGEKRNAFTYRLIEKLLGIECKDITVITNLSNVFSSGLDLSVFLQGRDAVLEYLFRIHRLVKKLLSCEGRLIAVVNGDVYGFGVEFLYFMDYVVAAKRDYKFSLQGVNLGVFPPYTVAIGRRLFAPAHLRVMLNREFTAEEAFHFGIVSQIGNLELKKLFSPPAYVAEVVSHRKWLVSFVDEAIPVFYKLAEVATQEETVKRLREFFKKS